MDQIWEQLRLQAELLEDTAQDLHVEATVNQILDPALTIYYKLVDQMGVIRQLFRELEK